MVYRDIIITAVCTNHLEWSGCRVSLYECIDGAST